jgi:hypothetical protein
MTDRDYKSLEELRGLSGDELKFRWGHSMFPYDPADCLHCLTAHHEQHCYGNRCGHADLRKVVTENLSFMQGASELKSRLEEMYAMRLYFADYYPFKIPTRAVPEQIAEPVDRMRGN